MTKDYGWLREAGRLGGLARAKKMSTKARRVAAKQAAASRWKGISDRERRDAARKAVLARWTKHRAADKKKPKPR